MTDADLARAIGEIEAFRVDGKFSPERYRQLLAAQNMTPAMFEQRLREDLVLAPLSEPLASGNIVAKSSAERFVALLEQQREVVAATVDAEPYAKDVRVDWYYSDATANTDIPSEMRFAALDTVDPDTGEITSD